MQKHIRSGKQFESSVLIFSRAGKKEEEKKAGNPT